MDAARERLGERADPRVHAVGKPVRDAFGDDLELGHATVQVHAEGLLVETQVLAPQPAVATHAAVAMGLHCDEVALACVAHIPAHRLDETRDFMAENDRRSEPNVPSRMWVSVPQMPTATGRMRISPVPAPERHVLQPEIVRAVEP